MDNQYKGWSLHTFKQVNYPPFLPFCCIARKSGEYPSPCNFYIFNIEGNTVEEAEKLARQRIDNKENNL